MANNNTYGVKLLPQDIYESAKNNLTKDDGCLQTLEQCRQLGYEGDPANLGLNETVNEACGAVLYTCFETVEFAFMAVTGVSTTCPSVIEWEFATGQMLTELKITTEKLL